MITDNLPQPGDIVTVRQRQYLVDEVVPQALRTDTTTLVRLVCLDDDAQGRALSVLWERELGAHSSRPAEGGLGPITALDPPRWFAAYLHALKWSSVTATDAQLFQAPFRAGIQLFDHQLVPLKKALDLPRVNLFIADDVGLGKTIEAGLVLQELMLRQRADFVLVVCPASVTLQWRDEMEKRFGLHFEIFSRDFVARRRQERGFQVNPWSTHARFIVSYQTLRRSEHFEPLRTLLQERGHHKALLVLDEAHVVAPASASRIAVDTETTRSIRTLTECFEHRLFLSATPHNGHSNSFSALLEMLDPQRFARGTRVRESQLEPVMVRRLKEDLRELGAAQPYPRRRVLTVQLTHDGTGYAAQWLTDGIPDGAAVPLGKSPRTELDLAELLARYTAVAKPSRTQGRLVFMNLQKRLLSSVEAFHRTLSVHARAFGAGDPATEQQDQSEALSEEYGPSDDDLEEQLDEETASETKGWEPPVDARPLLDQMLSQMLSIASRNRSAPDAKLKAFLAWIRAHQCSLERGAKWSDTRVIVFTEYGDTLRYLRNQLAAAFEGTDRGDERVAVFHGGMGDEARFHVQRTFNGSPADYPVRVLLATDSAREGLNLQGHCADLFHYDVPWNPSRMEQRNGRIDRAMQPEPEVRCGYFVYTQRAEDDVLDTLARKVDIIQRELGSLGAVLMEQMESALAHGITHETKTLLEKASEPKHRDVVQRELENERILTRMRAEIEEVGRIKERSQDVMQFEPALLRDALDVGFEMAGTHRMERTTIPDGSAAGEASTEAWRLPPLPDSWSRTLDSVRHPREKEESFWDWRRRSLLPVVFAPPRRMDSEVAQLHLSHPVVQRVLQRFLAQGFSASDLHRVTVVRSKRDSVARVIAFGRLSLFGAGAARLHDRVVSVAARWIDGGGKGHLKPFADEADRKAIELLEMTLAEAPDQVAVPEAVQRRLLATAADDFGKLWAALAGQGEELEAAARTKLRERGEAEAEALRLILASQREAIDEALGAQLDLDLDLADPSAMPRLQADQWRREREYLRQRRVALEQELLEQPDRLKSAYDVRLARLTPVGLVYLWPATR